jgi:hypothetical protein
MRGFSYTREFNTEDGYKKAMIFQRDNENDEVEWSKLIDTETGTQVTEYRRGMTIEI